MIVCKGIVRANVVLLQDVGQFPDGAEVEVRLLAPLLTRQEAFARVRHRRIERRVGMASILEEDKQEREEHPDTWLMP